MGLNDVRNYIIGALLFSIVIFSGVLMIGTFNTADSSLDSSLLDPFNQSLSISDDVTTTVNTLENGIVNADLEGNTGPLGWLNTLLGTAWNGLKAISQTLRFIGVAMTQAAEMFGVPEQISGLVVLIPVVIIIFALIVAIIRVNE